VGLLYSVMTHVNYYHKHNFMHDEWDILSSLPMAIRAKVCAKIGEKLSGYPLFSDDVMSAYVRGLIALKMKSVRCHAGYSLFGLDGEEDFRDFKEVAMQCLYIKKSKGNQVIVTTCPEKQFEAGSAFGWITDNEQCYDVICRSTCDFYMLERNHIIEVLQLVYPMTWETVLDKMKSLKFVPVKQRRKMNMTRTEFNFEELQENEEELVKKTSFKSALASLFQGKCTQTQKPPEPNVKNPDDIEMAMIKGDGFLVGRDRMATNATTDASPTTDTVEGSLADIDEFGDGNETEEMEEMKEGSQEPLYPLESETGEK